MSSFAADFGHWYPFLHGPENFGFALKNIARGLCLSWAEIEKVRPDARMMVSDTHEYWHALDDAARPYADFMNQRRFLTHDLYGGRIDEDYLLLPYLHALGFSEHELEWFREHLAPLDVVGIDYYPHSEHQVRSDPRGVIETPQGRLADETAQEQLGFARLVKQYFDHFRRPIILAETGAPGDDARKISWMDGIVQGIRQVREEGVPVIGIVWWGAIDQVDWDSNLRQRNNNINETGLWALQKKGHKLERVPTRALDAYRRYIQMPISESVGDGAPPIAPIERPTNAPIPA